MGKKDKSKSAFKSMKKSKKAEKEKDVVSGGGSYIKETDVYDAKITAMYTQPTKNGGTNLTIALDYIDAGGFIRNNLFVQNEKGENFYTYQGEDREYAGYVLASQISRILVGKPIEKVKTEMKTVELYVEGKKKKTKVPCFTPLIGKKLKIAVLQKLENKQVQNANNKWKHIADVREFNEIDKVFDAKKGRTALEIEAKTKPVILDKWVKTNQGKVRDARKIKDDQSKGKKKKKNKFK